MIRWFRALSLDAKILAVVLGLAAVPAILILWFLGWVFAGGNEYIERTRVSSPDGGLVAVYADSQLARQPLAATVAFYREIYLQRAKAPPLSDKTAREGFVFSDDGVNVRELRWLGPDRLLVILDATPEGGFERPLAVTIFDGAKQRAVAVDFKVERGASAAPTATP